MEISRRGRNKRGEIPEIITFSIHMEINETFCLVRDYLKSFSFLDLIKLQGMSIRPGYLWTLPGKMSLLQLQVTDRVRNNQKNRARRKSARPLPY